MLLLLTACGALLTAGSGLANAVAATKPKARKIKVDARSYAYSPKKIKVQVGQKVTIVLHSEDQRHDFTLEGGKRSSTSRAERPPAEPFKLAKPGTYTFYCSIPGHRAAGMEGTITAS